MTQESNNQNIATPIAIVIAGIIIAFSMHTTAGSQAPKKGAQPVQIEQPTAQLETMPAVTAEDHIQGDINAPVVIVEYSDTECPFCQRHHQSMSQLMETYGKEGKVAWVYRHFPIDGLHPKSRKEAEATECAAEQGGNAKFWAYMNRLMEITPTNNGLEASQLPEIAKFVGLDVNAFNTCLSSGKYAKKIAAQIKEAEATGGDGTPWNIIVTKSGKKFPLSGYRPVENLQAIVDAVSKMK
jgi:protein-disulfide isomerase